MQTAHKQTKSKVKVFRISTVSLSLNILLKGQLHYLDQYYDVTAISGNDPDLEEVREREGVAVYPITLQRQIAPLEDLKSLIKLYNYFRKEKPEIIHSITPKAGLLSMIAGKLAGVPIRIHTFTGLVFPYKTGILQKLLISMDKLLCYCATNIYPEGQGVKKDLKLFKITDKPLNIIGNGNVNGIDTAHFSPDSFSVSEKAKLRQELNIEATDFVFVFLGRLVKDKGINELVSAFMKIQNNSSKKLKLLLIGPLEQNLDPLTPEVLQTIDLNPDIISLGFQKDVRPYFAIGDALVFPSYREGFPNVVLQALSMGIPALVSDINGCNEIVEDGYNGSIFPAKDEIALQKSMEQILADHFYETVKANSRSSIMKYEQQVIWNLLKENYDNLLRQNGLI